MTAPDWDAIHKALTAPFSPEQVKQFSGRGGKSYSYIDARDCAERLDAAVGPGNWSFIPDVVDPDTCAVRGLLTIHGVTRGDIGYPNSANDADNPEREPLKAGVSDALKRAAVLFGVGRHLYREGKHADGGTQTYSRPAAQGNPNRPASDKQLALLRTLLAEYGYAVPEDLAQLPGTSASVWIEGLKGERNGGPAALLTNPRTQQVWTRDGYVSASSVRDASQQRTARQAEPTPAGLATGNQVAAITKLRRMLGVPDDGISDRLSSTEASTLIKELSDRYATTKRQGGTEHS